MLQNDFKGPVGGSLSGGIAVKEMTVASPTDAGVFIGQGCSQRARVGVSGLWQAIIRIAFKTTPMVCMIAPFSDAAQEGASLVEHFVSGLLRWFILDRGSSAEGHRLPLGRWEDQRPGMSPVAIASLRALQSGGVRPHRRDCLQRAD